jgi:hypothetical protein
LPDDQYDTLEERLSKQKKKQIKKIKERSVASFAFSSIYSRVIFGVLISLIAGIFIRKEQKPIAE